MDAGCLVAAPRPSFLVLIVAGPLMSEGGALAGTVGSVIGVGPDRGAALVLGGVGLALAVSTISLRRLLVGLSTPVA